jgi:hypothetical protein
VYAFAFRYVMVEARPASAGRATVFSILRTPDVRRNSPNHQCAESFFVGRQHFQRHGRLRGAADHEIWFTLLAIWAISPLQGSGQNGHQPLRFR